MESLEKPYIFIIHKGRIIDEIKIKSHLVRLISKISSFND